MWKRTKESLFVSNDGRVTIKVIDIGVKIVRSNKEHIAEYIRKVN